MTLAEYLKKQKKVPDAPGVYFFLGPRKEILYIGKAGSLRLRTRSYFARDLAEARGPLIVQMLERARSLDWRQTDSVLEALILEANLIKTHKPKYNTLAKDDKSFNYVVITREDFPRVLLLRGKELSNKELLATKGVRPNKIFGPFPHGAELKEALKLVRKIFPYRDTCVPPKINGKSSYPQKTRPDLVGRACFNRQLGLCPGVCTGEIGKRDYAKIVRHITLFFEGKKTTLVRELEREMKRAAKTERFEDAARLRRQLFALRHIQDVSLIKNEFRSPNIGAAGRTAGYRIEAYDVAHLQGSNPIGVMVVVENGAARKSEYRTFHIRAAKPGDDAGALQEILSRRFGHLEWISPRVIVVDGAKAQINAAEKVIRDIGVHIPIVGVVKDERHKARAILGDAAAARGRETDIILANAEAHRFALGRHSRLRRRNFLKP